MSSTCALRKSPGGFTLLELLVAMAIFAVVGALALGGLNSVLTQREVAERQLQRLHDIQRAVRLLGNDFSQISPRISRDALGSCEPPIVAPCGVESVVCFSHDGWRNPFAQLPRGTLQRAQYRLDDRKLIREYWSVMDRTLVNEPRSEVLLEDIEEFELSYLDRSGNGEWSPQWPPLEAQQQDCASAGLPLAIRVTLTLADWGEIVRLVDLVP